MKTRYDNNKHIDTIISDYNRRLDNIINHIAVESPEVITRVNHEHTPAIEEHLHAKFIGKLMGFLNYYKFAHWCAAAIDEHKIIDEFYSKLSDYIDVVAESIQGIEEQFQMSDLTVIPVSNQTANIKDVLNELKQLLQNFCMQYQDNPEYIGALDVTSTFLTDIAKYFYIFRLLPKIPD